MRLLWIEDDADQLDIMVKPLRDSGFEIKTVFDAKEAKELLINKNENFDLIILDILIPIGEYREDPNEFGEFTGLKLLKDVRDEKIKTPVIIFSVVDESDLGDISSLSVSKILFKSSLFPSELEEAVREVLGM